MRNKARPARVDLLEQARAVPTRQRLDPPTRDELLLALAFMRGELTTAQVGKVTSQPSGGGVRNWVLTTLVRATRSGMLGYEVQERGI